MKYYESPSWVKPTCDKCKYYTPNTWGCMYRCIPTWGERDACGCYERRGS